MKKILVLGLLVLLSACGEKKDNNSWQGVQFLEIDGEPVTELMDCRRIDERAASVQYYYRVYTIESLKKDQKKVYDSEKKTLTEVYPGLTMQISMSQTEEKEALHQSGLVVKGTLKSVYDELTNTREETFELEEDSDLDPNSYMGVMFSGLKKGDVLVRFSTTPDGRVYNKTERMLPGFEYGQNKEVECR